MQLLLLYPRLQLRVKLLLLQEAHPRRKYRTKREGRACGFRGNLQRLTNLPLLPPESLPQVAPLQALPVPQLWML